MKQELKELKELIENSGWMGLVSEPLEFISNKNLYLTLQVVDQDGRFDFHAQKGDKFMSLSISKAVIGSINHPQDAINSITSKIQNELL